MPKNRIHILWYKGSYHFFLERDVVINLRVPVCNVCHSLEEKLIDSEKGLICEKCFKSLKDDCNG